MRHTMRSHVASAAKLAVAACLLLAGTAAPAWAAPRHDAAQDVAGPAPLTHARVLASWPAQRFTESIAPDGHDGYLASVTTWGPPNVGQLWRVRATGGRTAFGPAIPLGACSMLLGVATAHDVTYVAVYDFEGSDCSGASTAPGILRVTATGARRLTTLPAKAWPNGVLIHDRLLYVTDSAAGAVWRIPLSGGPAPTKPWFTSPLLRGTTQHPIGANGIVQHDRALYVASSGRGLVLKLELGGSGTVRRQSVFAQSRRLVTVDGLYLDGHGVIWATVNTGALVQISRSGRVSAVAVPTRLDYPTQALVDRRGRVVVANGSFDKGTPTVVSLSSR